MKFDHTIYFVHRELASWPELRAPNGWLNPDDVPLRFNGRDCWITQTYLHLMKRGGDVQITDEFISGQINVVYYDDLWLKASPYESFIVAIEPDRPRPMAADFRIVQNHLQMKSENDRYITHWPQPGLKPRDPSRGTTLSRIGYLGVRDYLAEPYRDDSFLGKLREMGIELVIRDEDWTDYRDLDAVLAVRHVSPFDLTIKPPSKLINAWRAGCPALLGPEPAFRKLRQSPDDYFDINSPDEAIATLKKLRDEPEQMARAIEAGRKRAEDFTIDKIATRWEEILSGPVTTAYTRWQAERPILRKVRFAYRAMQHKQERTKFFKLIAT